MPVGQIVLHYVLLIVPVRFTKLASMIGGKFKYLKTYLFNIENFILGNVGKKKIQLLDSKRHGTRFESI